MNPQDITNRKFEKSTFGYKPEEVDEYLRDVSIALASAVKEKEENELKIVKLVEKINEYRTDEDAIRDALLVAQKQGNRIIAEAKAEAEKIISEAQAKREDLLANIQSDCDALKRSEIEKVAVAIRAENDKLAAVEAASKTKREMQLEKLNELKKDVTDFKRKLISILGEQTKLAVALPELTDEEIEEIMNAEDVPATPEEPKAEKPAVEDKHEQPKTPGTFSFSDYKRQNYSAEELKFGQNKHN